MNAKTGPIPVTMTDRASCPSSCPAKAACYAAFGPLSIAWKKLDTYDKALNWDGLCDRIRHLPKGQLWRHNTAGDLPAGKQGNEHINHELLLQLVEANRGRKGWTYTHKLPHVGTNAETVRFANRNGFTINLSANNVAEADSYVDLDVGPVVAIVPSSMETGIGVEGVFRAKTPAGNTLLICPASRAGSDMTCDRCGLCQKADRKVIIGFPAHGTKKRYINERLLQESDGMHNS